MTHRKLDHNSGHRDPSRDCTDDNGGTNVRCRNCPLGMFFLSAACLCLVLHFLTTKLIIIIFFYFFYFFFLGHKTGKYILMDWTSASSRSYECTTCPDGYFNSDVDGSTTLHTDANSECDAYQKCGVGEGEER